MDFLMERWYNAVGQRFSVRRYKAEPGEEELRSLRETAKLLSVKNVRIAIARSKKVFTPRAFPFAKIDGTECFAAFISNDAKRETVGYLGEAFILEATALGLGTCWLGGSFNKRAAMEAIELAPEEKIICVTPLGIKDEPYVGRPRKDLSRLTYMSQEELIALPDWQQRALECARLAPSAINKQPWEFAIDGENIFVDSISQNFGYGELDRGIAMLHIELGAAHCSVVGEWERDGESNVFTPRK